LEEGFEVMMMMMVVDGGWAEEEEEGQFYDDDNDDDDDLSCGGGDDGGGGHPLHSPPLLPHLWAWWIVSSWPLLGHHSRLQTTDNPLALSYPS